MCNSCLPGRGASAINLSDPPCTPPPPQQTDKVQPQKEILAGQFRIRREKRERRSCWGGKTVSKRQSPSRNEREKTQAIHPDGGCCDNSCCQLRLTTVGCTRNEQARLINNNNKWNGIKGKTWPFKVWWVDNNRLN